MIARQRSRTHRIYWGGSWGYLALYFIVDFKPAFGSTLQHKRHQKVTWPNGHRSGVDIDGDCGPLGTNTRTRGIETVGF